jgi:cell division protein FtsN
MQQAAPAKAQASAPVANAPLSLSPDANNAPPPVEAQAAAPPPPVRSAPPPAARVAPPPARTAAVASAPARASVATGSFLVQVSSQKSEADAESAYRGIQSKFPSVLGGQPHQVRRADLGAKGVYYRAMVGPFGTREAAVELCVSLKQRGGDCVVQH